VVVLKGSSRRGPIRDNLLREARVYFRLTLFNGITLFLAAATLAMAFARWRTRSQSTWFLLYYAVVVAYWRFFGGALDTRWVIAGTAAAVALRFEFLGGPVLGAVRAAEFVFLGYVLWRCTAMLLMLPW
jgi:hypothetical protein